MPRVKSAAAGSGDRPGSNVFMKASRLLKYVTGRPDEGGDSCVSDSHQVAIVLNRAKDGVS